MRTFSVPTEEWEEANVDLGISPDAQEDTASSGLATAESVYLPSEDESSLGVLPIVFSDIRAPRGQKASSCSHFDAML